MVSHRSSHRWCSVKKVILEISQNSQENTCVSLFFIKKETLTQVLFFEFCNIPKNTFSYKTPPVAASVISQYIDTRKMNRIWDVTLNIYLPEIRHLEPLRHRKHNFLKFFSKL